MRTIKLILSLSFLFFLATSCDNGKVEITKEEYSKLKGEKVIDFDNLTNPRIIVIDSCEYIAYSVYGYESITHKGNCKNHKK